jgi:hypothetical protein
LKLEGGGVLVMPRFPADKAPGQVPGRAVNVLPAAPGQAPGQVWRFEAEVPLNAKKATPGGIRPTPSQDLNRRLDQLLREIEQLRRDIQGTRARDSVERK